MNVYCATGLQSLTQYSITFPWADLISLMILSVVHGWPMFFFRVGFLK